LKIGIVPALKGEWMEKEISNSLNIKSLDKKRVNFFYDYHFGGYAKFDAELINFINKFKSTFEIQLDPIYTGKLFYGVFDLIKKDYFQSGSKILILHSGGLQGIDGFNAQHGNLIH
jgi:1-aminocyclopropane-1-carboxylate deaminase